MTVFFPHTHDLKNAKKGGGSWATPLRGSEWAVAGAERIEASSRSERGKEMESERGNPPLLSICAMSLISILAADVCGRHTVAPSASS